MRKEREKNVKFDIYSNGKLFAFLPFVNSRYDPSFVPVRVYN